ncbi:MAG: homoserine kinase [Balneolaceae bacterium]|nr:MAG: homoserine kinase [Balneolaceae bacterium]
MKKVSQQISVQAFAPATVANVGCGFDVLGFAIEGPGDLVTATFDDQPGLRIRSVKGENGRLPLEVKKNTAGLSALSLLHHTGWDLNRGICLDIEKRMPLGSGLGSSAASSVASVVAVNALIGSPLAKQMLLPFTVDGELAASGSAHADNVAASLLGGFVLVREHHPPDVISLPVPKELHCTIIHPHIEIETKNSRKILRKQILLENAVKQWANLGALVAAFYEEDYALLGRAVRDEVIEPVRSMLIPGFYQMQAAALKEGALGCSISGSGPSLFALSRSKSQAHRIGMKMGEVLKTLDLDFDLHISKINTIGAEVISEK